MSQKVVYQLLKELGGTATRKQISELAFKKYPNLTLHQYVSDRLLKLRKWGIIDFIRDEPYKTKGVYKIIEWDWDKE